MPAANKFNDYVNQKNRGVHNWNSNAFKLAFSSVAPVATNSLLADLTQIAAGNGYVAGGIAVTGVTLSMSGGTLTVAAAQATLTASGGAIASFRYYSLYNDTSSTPLKPLVMWWDHGSAVVLNSGDSFTAIFNNANPGTVFTDS